MPIEPYLFFEGRAEEAIEFYKKALGAEVVMLMRNEEAPDKPPPGVLPPNSGNKILHCTLKVGASNVMVSDGGCSGKANFGGFSLSISARDAAEADRLYNALADGGQVRMPIGKTFFSPRFGMVADKFGVGWMVIVPA